MCQLILTISEEGHGKPCQNEKECEIMQKFKSMGHGIFSVLAQVAAISFVCGDLCCRQLRKTKRHDLRRAFLGRSVQNRCSKISKGQRRTSNRPSGRCAFAPYKHFAAGEICAGRNHFVRAYSSKRGESRPRWPKTKKKNIR